ncbi:hypothetical protein [Enterococcus sp. AZ196]|uniref:hypothetical protein n=1 Tax=Enterococcus sp. AZ196 TaxID=2774659 RepID=UPI003D2D4FBF
MKGKKIVVAIGLLLGIGLLSQIVENNMNKPAIQSYAETNLKEHDNSKDTFDFKDEEEINFFE